MPAPSRPFPRFFPRMLPALLVAALAMPYATALAEPIYGVTVLGGAGSYASGINNAGDVVGRFVSGDSTHAFVYSAGGFTDLGTLGGPGSGATAINDSGMVVGWSDTGTGQSHAFLFSGGSMSDLGTLGGPNSTAWSINNRGVIVGSASTADETQSYFQHAFRYENGTMKNLGTLPGGEGSDAFAINNKGLIAGTSYVGPFNVPDYPYDAVTYGHGRVTDIGAIEFSIAYGVNDPGQIVGRMGYHGGEHAFLYTDGVVHDLGVLDTILDTSAAFDINNLGQVVGAAPVRVGEFSAADHGFLYSGAGGLTDLNTLVDPAGGWQITYASAINDARQIAAQACKDGECFAVRLDPISPVPEPASWAMLGAGLMLFGLRARRRAR